MYDQKHFNDFSSNQKTSKNQWSQKEHVFGNTMSRVGIIWTSWTWIDLWPSWIATMSRAWYKIRPTWIVSWSEFRPTWIVFRSEIRPAWIVFWSEIRPSLIVFWSEIRPSWIAPWSRVRPTWIVSWSGIRSSYGKVINRLVISMVTC